VRTAAIVAILLVVGTAQLRAAQPVTPASPPQTREDIWRAIFARPRPEPSPAEPEPLKARTALGRDLFHDTRLSGTGTRACVSCHDPARGFSNGDKRGIGLSGEELPRNVPALFNLAWGTAFFWDGRAPSLEDQARVPILALNEMAGDFPTIIARLEADAGTRARFAAAFPDAPAVSETAILAALAAYERTLVSPPTRFDRWVAGDAAALTSEELRGFDIFVGKGGCVACHGGWRLTDDGFHDIGLKGDDPGRGAVPGGVPGLRQFKTPSLRELAATAPYMHDGSLATLRDVVDHYTGKLDLRPSLAANVRRDLKLDEQEKQDLIAFLLSLSAAPGSATGGSNLCARCNTDAQ
jgi:cytochrome c peroxidase